MCVTHVPIQIVTDCDNRSTQEPPPPHMKPEKHAYNIGDLIRIGLGRMF